jgi:histone acetyltransferase (RNA polymerase elongator complex component)
MKRFVMERTERGWGVHDRCAACFVVRDESYTVADGVLTGLTSSWRSRGVAGELAEIADAHLERFPINRPYW